MIRTFALASLTLALTASAQAQQTATSTVPICDECFAMKAAAAGMAEVATSKLALQRSSSPEVKKFAERMIEEHTQVNSQLAQLAAQKRIPLPATLDPIHQVVLSRLAQLSGTDFDKEYLKEQMSAHKNAIHMFEGEAHKGEDAAIKGWASKTLPALKDHTKMLFVEVAGEKDEHEKMEKVEKYKKEVMSEKK